MVKVILNPEEVQKDQDLTDRSVMVDFTYMDLLPSMVLDNISEEPYLNTPSLRGTVIVDLGIEHECEEFGDLNYYFINRIMTVVESYLTDNGLLYINLTKIRSFTDKLLYYGGDESSSDTLDNKKVMYDHYQDITNRFTTITSFEIF